ncbi:hypothetical protein [Dietzia alimentaria]|uniref:hypothetical protein n=1 Tax=Dietzia alimentaria TaxID=665550 RepID=UPI0002F29430|nr:hypothetical protein [Dietzia alimentaria]
MSMNAAHTETIHEGVGRFGVDVEVFQEYGETWVILRQGAVEISVRPEDARGIADALSEAADYADE